MKIGLGVQQNNFLNVHRINQSIAKNNGGDATISVRKDGHRDTVTISGRTKANSLLESLMNQKISITEQKNSLSSSTLEKGESMDSIKSQLESYEEQLKNVDGQIAEMMSKEVEKQAEKMKPQDDKKPKTEEEIQNEQLADITSVSTDLNQAKTVASVKTRIDGDARVLKSDIELDKMRAGSSGGAKALIAEKELKLASMEKKSMNLTSKIADKLAATAEKVTDNNKHQEVVVETDNSVTDNNVNSNTDVSDKIPENNESVE